MSVSSPPPLHPAGRETYKWPVWADAARTVPLPAAQALDVSFDGVTWSPMDRPADGQAEALVSGPTAVGNPAGTIVLARGRNKAFIRRTANPEAIIRPAGFIDVDAGG